MTETLIPEPLNLYSVTTLIKEAMGRATHSSVGRRR